MSTLTHVLRGAGAPSRKPGFFHDRVGSCAILRLQGMLRASQPAAVRMTTVGFVGHPNVGKTSLLNAIVGRKVASVSRTPGHTKHLQTWELSTTLTICDSPGLVFPVAGALRREQMP